MYPRLIEIGPVTLYSYGLLLALAFLAGLQLARVRASRLGLDRDRVLDLGILIIIAAIVGGKLLLAVTDLDLYLRRPSEIFSLARSGGVFYGGLILSIAVSIWYMRRHRMPLWPTADSFAPGIALGHAIGRVGCVLAGCCYGRPTELPWGIVFTDPFTASYVGTPLNVPLHPVQLYESGVELAILAVLLGMERRSRGFPGRTIWSYVLLYGVVRFLLEFFRGDERGMLLGFSTSQVISLILVPLAVVMLVRLSRRRVPAAETAATAARSKPKRRART